MDHLFIHLIVLLNALCQAMLIWRLKLAAAARWKFCAMTLIAPATLMIIVRLLVAGGAIHGQLSAQSPLERVITASASVLLLAGPWLVTASAICFGRRQTQRLMNTV